MAERVQNSTCRDWGWDGVAGLTLGKPVVETTRKDSCNALSELAREVIQNADCGSQLYNILSLEMIFLVVCIS